MAIPTPTDTTSVALYAAGIGAGATLVTATITTIVNGWLARRTARMQHSHDQAMLNQKAKIEKDAERTRRREDAYVAYLQASDAISQSWAIAKLHLDAAMRGDLPNKTLPPRVAGSNPGDELFADFRTLASTMQRIMILAPETVRMAVAKHFDVVTSTEANLEPDRDSEIGNARNELMIAIRKDLDLRI